MSETLVQSASPSIWMQQTNGNSNPFQPRLYNDFSDAYNFDTSFSASSEWPLYGSDGQLSNHMTRDRQPPLVRPKPNKRALSHSTTTNPYDSRSQQQPQQQQQQQYNRGDLSYHSGFDAANTPFDHFFTNTQQQLLPSPSVTPTSDSFLIDRGLKSSRSRSAAYLDSAMAAQRTLKPTSGDSSALDMNDPGRSPGLSVSSYGQDLPATPRTSNGDCYGGGNNNGDDHYGGGVSSAAMRQVPTFSRTTSDAYQDELYNPASITSAPSAQYGQAAKKTSMLSPYRSMVNDRLQAAHDANQSTVSPSVSATRNASPFRQGSPFATGVSASNAAGKGAGSQPQQQMFVNRSPAEESQKTISPKDAVLDFNDSDDQPAASSLFPDNNNGGLVGNDRSYNSAMRSYAPLSGSNAHMPTFSSSQSFNFQPMAVPSALPLQQSSSQEYKVPQHFRRNATNQSSSSQEQPLDFPAHLVSMETTRSSGGGDGSSRSNSSDGAEDEAAASEIRRPADTSAGAGTYTCTYHGCTQRFATPALLQKHKKEGHRSQAAQQQQKSQSPTSEADGTDDPLLKNSQAGPHKCDRINPSTGKPCNTIFSRPYDLTRHEDTIHAQRTKVRCQYCTEEKTFSRSDALTRHMRVVHPHINFPQGRRRK